MALEVNLRHFDVKGGADLVEYVLPVTAADVCDGVHAASCVHIP